MAAPVFAGLDLNHLQAPASATPSWGRSKPLSLNNFANALLRGPDWAEFLTSDLGYEDGNDEDWLPTKVLGKGGFGKVALWSKKNDLSDVVDNIAVKQRYLEHNPLSSTGIWMNNLAREAYIQSQLTSQDQHNCIVPLKGYKYYAAMRQCRLYMEYAPHGTLETIGKRFWASERYLPELWLWCVFEKLAEACFLMRTCPTNWERMQPLQARDQRSTAKFILHCDIKPGNIFLYDRQPMRERSRKLPQVPIVKLGDFGLAQVTTRTAFNNPRMLTGGTRSYKPPEVRLEFHPPRLFDELWQLRVHLQGQGQKYNEQHNIWALGKVMHDLAFLQDPELCHQQLFALQEQDYYNGAHPLCGHFALPYDTTNPLRPVDYSQGLRDLIRECLLPDIILRPKSRDLLDSVQELKQKCIDDIKEQHRPQHPRESDEVQLTTVEMNNLPYRPEANFPTGVDANGRITDQAWEAWQEIRNSDYFDPDEPLFAPPRAKWAAFYQREDAESPFKRRKTNDYRAKRWVQVGNKVQLRPNLDELSNARRQEQRNRQPKRMQSWDENIERDANIRQKLRELRRRTPYAENQPLAMFELILRNAGHVVSDAEEVLGWLYRPNVQPDWTWLQEAHIPRKARRVRQRLDALNVKRNLKECKYFVRHSAYGVEQVDHAVAQMMGIFTT